MYFYGCQYHILRKAITKLSAAKRQYAEKKNQGIFGKTKGLKSNIIREEIKKQMCELISNIMILPSHSASGNR